MGLKNNETIATLLLFGIIAICILTAGYMIRTWQVYVRDKRYKAMYRRRIGAFTTPPHGDPEAGEIA